MTEYRTADALYRALREARAEYRAQAPLQWLNRVPTPPTDGEPPVVDRMIAEFVRRAREELGGNLVSIVLYGSVARGDYKPQSDIDLLLVCEKLPEAWPDRRQLVRSIRRDIERSQVTPEQWTDETEYHRFSVLLKTREEASKFVPLYLDMTTDARLLHDREGFFANVLSRLRARLRELGSIKCYHQDGTWYWDLSPGTRFGESVTL